MYNINEDGVTVGEVTVPWAEIEKYQELRNIKDRILVKMTVTYARDDYHNYELINIDEWNKFKELLQQYDISTVPIGEIAGKHSDVWINWKDPSFYQEITDLDQILSFYRVYGFYDSNTDGQFIWSTEEYIRENF